MHPVVRKVLKPIFPCFPPSMRARLQKLYALVFQRQTPAGKILSGEAYADISAHCGEVHFDVVLFGPWLKRGGADKTVLQYLRYYAERGYRVLLILTEIADSPWLDQVPAGVMVVEAKAFLSGLSPDDCDLVLSRLLLQHAPALIHVVNSAAGWEILCNYFSALKANGSRLAATLFCDDYDELGRPEGYAQSFMPSMKLALDMVITDSSQFGDALVDRFGLDRRCLTTVHSGPFRERNQAISGNHAQDSVASRFCPQKRPDILLSIAQALPDVTFVIHGEVDPRSAPIAAKLKSLRNVRWHGPFNSFAELQPNPVVTGSSYTSGWDGLPNVLVEAVAAGLPIIAPDVGGVRDLCKPATGWLIGGHDDAGGYVVAIRDLLSNRAEALRRREQASNLLEQNHSKRAFDETMDGVMAGLGIAASAREREAL